MVISRNELINILDSIGLEYELDSDQPGVVTKDKNFCSYSELKLPSDYYKKSRNFSNQFSSNFDMTQLSYKENDNGRKYFIPQKYTKVVKSNKFKNDNTVDTEALAA
ncbi:MULTISPECIES: hypothetical protein [Lactococcus]|uniref:Uncharacterized protein n=1 Tax=Lactococcus garvieae TaxID=1363 RepID=A0AA46YU51_9LACT|nr:MULTISPECIES: hypothetical protein [Lactococcus]QSR13166.1 hypothetical protein J0J35_01945 [Lactococcus sp. LG606]UYT11294.1 hypothetical protein OF801_04925 [Lactococcus garvieae]UYT13235.1 hypothetical protein OF800_04400 [Lactococcus garvieae]